MKNQSVEGYLRQLWQDSSLVTNKLQPPGITVLEQISSFFTPGDYYYYIIDFANLKISDVHGATEKILGYPNAEVTFKVLTESLAPEYIPTFKKIESFADWFFRNKVGPGEVLNYKAVYAIPFVTKEGNRKTILHQGMALGASPAGEIQYLLNVHMEMDQLMVRKAGTISFIGMNGRPSFYNIDPDHPDFEAKPAKALYSRRELQIIELISLGRNNKEMSDILHLSPETLATHRKNILKKSDAKNFNELVAHCIRKGII